MKNIDEYCEKILFSESLEDKLSFEKVSLNKYSSLTKCPEVPGRPQELIFGKKGAVKLPSIHQLDNVRNCGLLLHFFLNHELLALEIMALVLLKFPELPNSFKRSLLKTMADEQKHASSYIRCMNEFGVECGEMSVNSFSGIVLKI